MCLGGFTAKGIRHIGADSNIDNMDRTLCLFIEEAIELYLSNQEAIRLNEDPRHLHPVCEGSGRPLPDHQPILHRPGCTCAYLPVEEV